MKFLIIALALISSIGLAHAEKRVALVIGNSNYKQISSLANPKNDAALMASTLKNVGFDVVSAIDVDFNDMRKAVREFGRALRSSGKDAVGLLYYAGHGVQAHGKNYLIPVGADIQSIPDLEIEALSASDVLAQMEEAGNALNLVILDACRNNPFPGKDRALGGGLARIQAASGTLIAFAAAPGQIAVDGAGAHSPYTSALVDSIQQPGLAVEQVFKRARIKVESQTSGKQTPWEESSLTGDFYFVPKTAAPSAAQSPDTDKETVFWNTVKDSNSVEWLQAYINLYPDGAFAALAGLMIKKINEQKSEALIAQSSNIRAAQMAPQKGDNEVGHAAQAEADGPPLDTESPSRPRLKIIAGAPDEPPAPELPTPRTVDEMFALALRLDAGDGLTQDTKQAALWFAQAAQGGHPEAKYRLGLLYYEGRGVAQSYSSATEFILDAVKAKNEPAFDALINGSGLREPEFIIAVQQHLKRFGNYSGLVDGMWGDNTRQGILKYTDHEDIKAIDKPARSTAPKQASQEREAQRKKTVSPKKSSGSCIMFDGKCY